MENKEKIIFDIYKKYPLTLLQRLRIMCVLNNKFYIKNTETDEYVKKIFNLIFTPIKTDCEIDNEFDIYIKKCLAEFFTFEYCIDHNIKFKPNKEYIICLKNLLDDLSNHFSVNELEPLLFRINADNFIYYSNNAYRILQQFKDKQKIYKKRND